MRAWIIDSEKEKVVGEIQRHSMDHWKGSPKRQKPEEQERNRNLGFALGGWQRAPECWAWGHEDPLPRGDTQVLREAGAAPTKETRSLPANTATGTKTYSTQKARQEE